jgi:hypothetical protein
LFCAKIEQKHDDVNTSPTKENAEKILIITEYRKGACLETEQVYHGPKKYFPEETKNELQRRKRDQEDSEYNPYKRNKTKGGRKKRQKNRKLSFRSDTEREERKFQYPAKTYFCTQKKGNVAEASQRRIMPSSDFNAYQYQLPLSAGIVPSQSYQGLKEFWEQKSQDSSYMHSFPIRYPSYSATYGTFSSEPQTFQ